MSGQTGATNEGTMLLATVPEQGSCRLTQARLGQRQGSYCSGA